jgi:hypothetical protein
LRVGGGGLQGYEFNFAVSHDYLQIVRWDGAAGNYTYVGSSCTYPAVCGQVSGIHINNGDVFTAVSSGNTHSVYWNGTLVAQATDSPYLTGGAPGMGFDYGCDSTYANFGFSQFSATDEPAPPQGLKVQSVQ